jgi:putative flippase GtrA
MSSNIFSKNIKKINKDFLRHTAGRYFLVGVIGAIIELIIFSGLVRVGLGIFHSNFFAFHVAFSLCFFLHYHYTHKKPYEGKLKIASGFVKYAGLMYAQFVFGSLVLWFLIDKLNWMPEIAKFIQIGIVIPVSYIFQKMVIFRKRESS